MLKSAFRDGGTVTAAASSSINDGAAALVLMGESTAQRLGRKPIARILGHAGHSQAPEWFTTAPIAAIRKLCTKVGWALKDVDLFEINEAFAVVPMAAMKDLGISHTKVNIHGGACVLGHSHRRLGCANHRDADRRAQGIWGEARNRGHLHRRRRSDRHGDRAVVSHRPAPSTSRRDRRMQSAAALATPRMNQSTFASIHNYRFVDGSLCTSGQPTVLQLREIAEAGFTTLINLALHDDPRYSLTDEAGVVQSLGMVYVHIPVQFAAPKEADLLEFFAAMQAHECELVWVHCAANIRVSAFLGLYRVIKQGWERARAFELMESLWRPDEVWSSFIDATLAKHRCRPGAESVGGNAS